jgi:hypothetical protein
MLKGVFFFINVIVLILFNIAADTVTVTQTAPKRVETGNSFIVNVTINKAQVTGYAKYQVVLPAGVTGELVDGKDAKFTVDGNKLKFVWVSLPQESTLNISYKVIINAANVKEIALSGAFAYLVNNERQTVDVATSRVLIGAKPNNTPVVHEPVVAVQRTIDDLGDGSYRVTVNVQSEHVQGFAKVQEKLPANATAKSERVEDAVFSQVASKVKFVWMNFPEDKKDLTVSYIVTYDQQPEITGEFAYLFKGESRKAPIQLPGEAPLANLQEEAQNPPAVTTTPEETAEETTTVYPENEAETTTPTAEEVTEVVAVEEQPKETVTPVPVTTPAETGIMFKVQIMAGHNAVNADTYFANKYNFQRKVVTDLHEGWHKYITGNHSTYVEARDLRNNITDNFNFRGPFVVAYNNGERITVQEALMATQQKWVN